MRLLTALSDPKITVLCRMARHQAPGRPARQRGAPVHVSASPLPRQPMCGTSGCLRIVVVSLVTGFGLGLGVLGAEGVGDPLVRGVSLPVDTMSVDLQQNRDVAPGASANGISDLRLPVQSTCQ